MNKPLERVLRLYKLECDGQRRTFLVDRSGRVVWTSLQHAGLPHTLGEFDAIMRQADELIIVDRPHGNPEHIRRSKDVVS